MRYLSYRNCLGIDKPDRLCHASELETLLAIQSHGDLNPVQASRLKELQAAGDSGNPTGVYSPGQFFGSSGGGGGNTAQSALDLMKQAQAFQVQQNQPAIASLQTEGTSLQQQYADMLKEIQGGQSAQTTFTTGAVNSSLAQRGIDPNSVYGQEQFGSALTPVNQQYGGLEAQLAQGSADTLLGLAQSIAGLQAGNVPQAMNFGANIAGLANALAVQQLANQAPINTTGNVFANGSFQSLPVNTPPTKTNVSGGGGGGGANPTINFPQNTNTTSYGPASSGNSNVSNPTRSNGFINLPLTATQFLGGGAAQQPGVNTNLYLGNKPSLTPLFGYFSNSTPTGQ